MSITRVIKNLLIMKASKKYAVQLRRYILEGRIRILKVWRFKCFLIRTKPKWVRLDSMIDILKVGANGPSAVPKILWTSSYLFFAVPVVLDLVPWLWRWRRHDLWVGKFRIRQCFRVRVGDSTFLGAVVAQTITSATAVIWNREGTEKREEKLN